MTDRTVVYRLRAELGQWRTQMAQASASTRKLAHDLTSVDKEGAKTRRGLDTLGGAAGKFGLVAAAGLGAAVVKAANFDAAMSNVQAATHETAGNMEELRQAALQAGADTAFSASEAAAGIENLAKAGVATSDILDGGLTGALDLAAAGGLDVATAAEAAATAMTQFSLSGADVPHIADLLAAGAGKAQGEVTDLSMALNQSGLVAAQMGLSIEETTGGLAAFASAGLLGSDAGTSLKTMLLRLANPSQAAAETMEELGINAYDAQGNFIGLEALSGQLETAFAGQSQATRDAGLATIFGSDAIRAANVLYTQGADGISDWTDKVNDAGFAAETAAIKQDNLRGDLEKLGGALETALIGTGDGAQGPLRSLVQGLEDVVNAFNDLPPVAKDVTGALLGITAITGGGLWFGSKVIGGIASTRSALADLGFTAGQTKTTMRNLSTSLKFGGALVALTALTSALDELDKGVIDSDLDRNLEALTGGRVSDDLQGIGEDLRRMSQGLNTIGEPLEESATLFGLIGDTNLDRAQANVEKIDQALAGMVESGNAGQAAEAFAVFQEQAAELGVSGDDVASAFDSYATALDNAAISGHTFLDSITGLPAMLGGLTDGESALSVATERAAKRQERHNAALKESRQALRESRKQARETADEFFGLGEGLDDAKLSLGEWLKQLEKQAEALRNFRINAEKAAKKGLDEGLIASLQEAGPAGALRMRQLANATDEEIDRANRAWKRGQAEVNKYTDAVGGARDAGPVETQVTVNATGALSKLHEINHIKLDDKTITVHTVIAGGGEGGADFVSGGQRSRRAFGGPVYGPGTATSDSVPIWASHGEYVVKAAAVEKYGTAFFDSVNAMRFASGGAVGASTVNHYGAGIDYDRLAAAVGRSQLYGDVYMQPHNYGEFQRQMLHDRQQASAGGVPM